MLAKRIIPCLDVDAGRVVKGVRFEGLRDAGDPVELAAFYDSEGADELVFLDITASHERRELLLEVASRTAESLFIPFTVGGGVRNVADVRRLLRAGADKVAVNTAAVERPELVGEAAAEVGAQAIVVAIDARRTNEDARPAGPAATGERYLDRDRQSPRWPGPVGSERPPRDPPSPRWEVYAEGGRVPTGIDAVAWARRACELGAGEILLTSMDRDGTTHGYDLDLTRTVAGAVPSPVIASGGAGAPEDLADAVDPTRGGAQAALAASMFHFRRFSVMEAKRALEARALPVRMPR